MICLAAAGRNQRLERVTVLIGTLLLGPVIGTAEQSPSPPQWIWTSAGDSANGPVTLAQTFDVARLPQRAILQVAGDFCDLTVQLNAEPVLAVEDFSPLTAVDVTRFLQAGANRIVISARPTSGPPAVALGLDITQADGTRTRLASDGTWLSGSADRAAMLGEVAAELWGDQARSIEISPFDNYEQWRQAIGAEADRASGRFWTVPQFEIELVRAAGPDEGSWISIAFDRQGRATIGREDQGLLRLRFEHPGGAVAEVETIDNTLLECRGLVYAGDDLYVNANKSSTVCVLRDADGDGRFDEPAVVRAFPGGFGHGRNDLTRGVDGQVYGIAGDSVDVPRDVFDRTSPFREARRGATTSEGFVAVLNPATAAWELMCAGMRNPFGIAFNADGEAFTYDADAEFDMGAPWYRPTRILHLVSGADYGWRGVTKQWPPYDPDRPDNALPVLDIGKGSPTAVDFGDRSAFPPRYRNALFVLDWAYGRVLAVHLQPRGAGYAAQAETFLQGQPLNVCGLDFGPDGAMYLVTGGRKTSSGLYRVRYTGEAVETAPAAPHAAQCIADARNARDLRRRLEASHGRSDPAAVDAAWPSLNSTDPVLRYAARTAIEHQPVSTWQTRALEETRTTASLTALVALLRSQQSGVAEPVLERTTKLDFTALTLSQQLTLIYLHNLCLDQAPETLERWRPALLAQLDAALADSPAGTTAASPMGDGRRLQRELSRLLLRLGAPRIVDRLIAGLGAASTQEDRMHVLFLLRDVRDGWTPELHRTYFAALRDTDHYQGGEGMPGFLQSIRDAALARLSEAERLELGPLLATSVLDEPLPVANRPVVQKWSLEELADLVSDSAPRGDARQGAALFREAHCTRCHRVGASGPAVGPDLSYVARRFTRRDMLESILLPSQVVAENYRNVEVLTTDGRVIVGRPLMSGDYRAETLRIATDPLRPSVVVELDKKDIDLHQLSPTSPMPAGLLDTFTREEIADLLAYLEDGAAVHLRP